MQDLQTIVTGDNLSLIAYLLLLAYEITARFLPTTRDISALNLLVKILDVFVKNRATITAQPSPEEPAQKLKGTHKLMSIFRTNG